MNAHTFTKTNKSLLNLAIIAVIFGVSGSAIADSNQAYIDQAANNQYTQAMIDQTAGSSNLAHVWQGNTGVSGTYNDTATITQTGSGGTANIAQGYDGWGSSNSTATVMQGGSNEYAEIRQDGYNSSANQATVNQSGVSQNAYIVQSHSNDFASVVQSGSYGTATIHQ